MIFIARGELSFPIAFNVDSAIDFAPPVFSKKTFHHIQNCIKSTFVSPNGTYNTLLEKKLRKITNSK